MPAYQTMLGELNKILGDPRERPDGVVEMFAPGREFTEAADALGVTRMEGVGGYIEKMPPSIIESLRAAIYSGLTRNMAVTVSWAPAYDYEVNVWEAPGTDETAGGITVLLKSRYPKDAHPISG